MTITYCEWTRFDNGDKMWSRFNEHFNEAFNELQEFSEITVGGIGFEANAMEHTLMAID